MKVIEILKVSKKIVETLQSSCIRVSDVRYVAMYEEYEAMVARGEKKSYAVAHLAEKYGISEQDGYRREEMRQRMRGIRSEGFRNADYRKSEEDYDEGYRKGYEDGYRDHEEESMSRMKDFRGRSM